MEITKLIFTDITANNNKFWQATLNDNDSILVEYGRVGKTAQQKLHPSGGHKKYDQLIRSKQRKGYTLVKALDAAVTSGGNASLAEIVKSQVATESPEASKLLDTLVKENIHQIVSNTQVAYDVDTGLFSTPLGVVTEDTISEARLTLGEIKAAMDRRRDFTSLTNDYMRLIPQDIGMKRVASSDVFPDVDAVVAQHELLDKLLVSVESVKATPVKQCDEPLPKVFDLRVDVAKDADASRLERWFESSKKRQHGYSGTSVDEVFVVESVDGSTFDDSVGNVVEVFHGSTAGNCLSIMKSGLRADPPKTAHVSGKMFGWGVYGALSSTKSLGYSFGRWGGVADSNGWLFICDFAMGKTFEPSSSVGGPPAGYDSVWARAAKTRLANDELIVYDSSRCRLKYLLKCSGRR